MLRTCLWDEFGTHACTSLEVDVPTWVLVCNCGCRCFDVELFQKKEMALNYRENLRRCWHESCAFYHCACNIVYYS